MMGNRGESSEAAQEAVSLEPNLGRTQITLGFAALAEFRNEDARAYIEYLREELMEKAQKKR